MKTLYKVVLFGIILFSAACSKESRFLVNTSLTGKWQLNATYMDPGDGSGTYRPVANPGNNSINLKENGAIEVTGLNAQDNFLLYFSQYKSYATKDSTTLVFKKQGDTTAQKFIYKIEGDKLTLLPAGPIMCFEGCGVRFQKVN